MKHETQMLAAIRVVALTWFRRGTTRYPPPFVQALSNLFREAYFVEHGEYPEPPDANSQLSH